MRKRGNLAWIAMVLMSTYVAAQTPTPVTTTNGGTANTVPMFTTSSNVENSPISISGSNVGIGTTAPTVPLVVTQPSTFSTAASFQYTLNGQAIANTLLLNKPALVQIVGGEFGNNTLGLLGLVQPGVQNGGDADITFAASRSTTAQLNAGTYSPLQLNDSLGMVDFGGDDGTNLRASSAGIQVNATAAWSATSSPAHMSFLTTPQGSTTWAPRMTIADSGNVGIGTTNPGKLLDVSGTIRTSANANTNDSGGVIFPDGTAQTTAWTGVLCGGDYAEAVKASGKKQSYEPGDVLELTSDSQEDVRKSSEPYSTMVAGIYATKPGVIGERQSLKNASNAVPMAMVGIVPTKVTAANGAIHRGDLLVSSAVPGYAMKGTDRSRMLGAVIGKAMGSLDSGQGVIEVLVTLQ